MSNPMIAAIERDLQQLDAQALRRRRRVAETPCAPRQQVDGRSMLAFCSNDYLGLAAHPRVVEALREGASLYGAGSGASHLISGHGRSHALLEQRLAEFLAPNVDTARALYFCTGYMANLAIITALAGKGAEIFSEELNHASLIDGARLSRAKVQVYPHANLTALGAMLAASAAATKIVVTDSVFSMDGDLAPLAALAALCERHGAWLVIDDAHGFGVLGDDGRGALACCGVKSSHVVYMGTLSKAAGVGGAFVAAHESVIEWLVQRARPYIYTTAAAPALAHALLTSIDIIASDEGRQRRAHLQQLIRQLREGLHLQRWQHAKSDTAIQPVIIGPNDEAMAAAAALYEQGYWVPAIRPPTVPAGTSRLRITLSAAHAVEDVAQVISAVNALEQQNVEAA